MNVETAIKLRTRMRDCQERGVIRVAGSVQVSCASRPPQQGVSVGVGGVVAALGAVWYQILMLWT